jgi:hypothetical protein
MMGWFLIWPYLGAVASLVVFYAFGASYLDGFILDFGNVTYPVARYAYFLLFWMFLGSSCVVFLTLGIARNASTGLMRVLSRWTGASRDVRWLTLGALAGFAIPVLIRRFVLEGAPLTDDESGYRFMAECLASGRLMVPSPPMKLFFDNVFMINDGHLYAEYFLGWPALMVPGVVLGIPGYMNAFYSALTVPGLFFVIRRVAGSGWAKLGIIFYLVAPLLMIGAATGLSHTTCTFALVWMAWFALRSADEGAPWWAHAGTAFTFAVAFFIRPTAALGIGLPFLVYWLPSAVKLAGQSRLKAMAAFSVSAAAMALVFLSVNKAQNGSYFLVSYQRAFAYAAENGYRFSGWTAEIAQGLHNFDFSDPVAATAKTGIALLRLNAALFGWPFSFALLPFAVGRGRAGVFWAALVCFVAFHFFLTDPGIDTFGPAHYAELAWPVLVLSVLGARQLHGFVRRLGTAENSFAVQSTALSLVAALLVTGILGYVPTRLRMLSRMASSINMPRDAVSAAGIENAVVFYSRPYTRQEPIAPTRHFVFWRPNNDPDLENSVLWANHLGLEEDRQLMRLFPGREAYYLAWSSDNRPEIRPLNSVQPHMLPHGLPPGHGR